MRAEAASSLLTAKLAGRFPILEASGIAQTQILERNAESKRGEG